MKPTRHLAEKIMRELRTAEQLISLGKTGTKACRIIELTK